MMNNSSNSGHVVGGGRGWTSPQSAPPSLSKPIYCVTNESESELNSSNDSETSSFNSFNLGAPTSGVNGDENDNNNNDSENPTDQLQVIEVYDAKGQEDRVNNCFEKSNKSQECSPEPIIEVKQTSSSASSSSNSPKSGGSPISSGQSSDCDDYKHNSIHQQHQLTSSSSNRIIRRRTVRRSYHHRATQEECCDSGPEETKKIPNEQLLPNGLIKCPDANDNSDPNNNNKLNQEDDSSVQIINESESKSLERLDNIRSVGSYQKQETGASESESFGGLDDGGSTRSHFRTRQIGAYYGCQQSKQQQQSLSTSTSSSKVAKCSITTNRKSTSRQVVSASQSESSSSSLSSANQKNNSQPDKMATTTTRTSTTTLGGGLFEREQSAASNFSSATDITTQTRRSIEVEQEEESRVHHRESFNSSSRSLRCGSNSISKQLRETAAAASISSASSSETRAASLSRHAKTDDGQHQILAANHFETLSSSSSRLSSLFVSSQKANRLLNHQHPDQLQLQQQQPFLSVSDDLFTSPDVRSLVKEIGTDFAELENALVSSTGLLANQANSSPRSSSVSSLSTRLFGSPIGQRRQLSPIRQQQHHITTTTKGIDNHFQAGSIESGILAGAPSVKLSIDVNTNQNDELPLSVHGAKIRELLDKAQRYNSVDKSSPTHLDEKKLIKDNEQVHHQHNTSPLIKHSNVIELGIGKPEQEVKLHESRCKAVMNESIERIDQRMSELCKKLEDCQNTDEAIDLLKIMIQMIEKAWSVPVCGDDLGFKLCNSLRHAGGLDIILGFINEADEQIAVPTRLDTQNKLVSGNRATLNANDIKSSQIDYSQQATFRQRKQGKAPLKLSLSKLIQPTSQQQVGNNNKTDRSTPSIIMANNNGQSNSAKTSVKDNDSDTLTSDLGLDSTSIESYVSGGQVQATPESQLKLETDSGVKCDPANETTEEESDHSGGNNKIGQQDGSGISQDQEDISQEEIQKLRKEELVFLSARLLSQCLTSENRDYIVKFDLDPVIKLACNFTVMKSIQSKRLLSRSSLKLQTKNPNSIKPQNHQEKVNDIDDDNQINTNARESVTDLNEPIEQQATNELDNPQQQQSDIHSAIGTEILQHLFKHSEETCSTMISLGALQAILYGCRSSNIETLRHCASALANLALYGGSDSQQIMIEQKAHVWLFPLAFNEDDNVQYYACLAIVVLAANQEIEADVLKSSTLDLVEPFVTSHEPRRFAESTTAHIHGQSAGWLRKLIPLLESKREEARNLACFHFAMEAYIKREQDQTQVFKEIGAIEPLRKAGSSPIAIASKFACQALRLIGEKEPHKLSQQVPLWTCEDVCEWVNQIGFEKFRPAFLGSHVDGDLLLQLDDDMLKYDIGIDNGIIRRRFLRELSNLKRIADFSSVDKSGLSSLLATTCANSSASGATINNNNSNMNTSSTFRDFTQYIYPILQMGVTRDNIHLVDCDQLLAECKITNTIHRMKLARCIKELQEKMVIEAASHEQNSSFGQEQKTLDCFVSYRRSTGSQLASLLKVHLQLRGFSVFIDVERLEAGKFDNNLLDSIKTAKNFILVLSQNALDRCIGDHECKDWVHKEIVAALSSNCNIIPIMDNFQWPDAEQLPEDMRSIPSFNSVRWIHDYQDACVDKLERFIRGDWPSSLGASQQTAGSISSISMGGGQSSLQRLTGTSAGTTNVSTPSVAATPSLCSTISNNNQQPPIRAPHPSESDHHPLSFVTNTYLHQQHSSNASNNRRM